MSPEEDRFYAINLVRKKKRKIDFDYDKLSAPPILSMFTPYDIQQLNQIARSIKLASKPQVKYKEIDRIMRSRGFVKYAAGTNRVVYRPVEDNTFLVKVAYDAIGLGDNPREFQNQFIFKPFVTKVFEVTPCGTLGVFERVLPITNREEFFSIAPDYYRVVTEWFLGEYVMEDIGTDYFMNWGVRKGFGPVLLDFPYAYKLDGTKLFCKAPSNESPTGFCEGEIDYNFGFNMLKCKKCGAVYRARELAKAIEEGQIKRVKEGASKMKIRLKGGSLKEEKVIETTPMEEWVRKTPAKLVSKKKYEEPVIEEVKRPKKVISPITFEESPEDIKKRNKEKLEEAIQTILDLYTYAEGEEKEEIVNKLLSNFVDILKVSTSKEGTFKSDEEVIESIGFTKKEIKNKELDYVAYVCNINNVINTDEKYKVIVLIDEEGALVRNEKDEVIIVGKINDKSVGSVAVVSSEWLDKVLDETDMGNPLEEEPDWFEVDDTDLQDSETDPNDDGLKTVNGVQ